MKRSFYASAFVLGYTFRRRPLEGWYALGRLHDDGTKNSESPGEEEQDLYRSRHESCQSLEEGEHEEGNAHEGSEGEVMSGRSTLFSQETADAKTSVR